MRRRKASFFYGESEATLALRGNGKEERGYRCRKDRENIERLIKESGWSVKDIAVKLGVSSNAVRHWIKGRNFIDSANLIRLALLFGVHAEELYVLKEVIFDEQVS